MSRPLRWGLVAIALAAGWAFFGERLAPTLKAWMAPIEPSEYADPRGDPDGLNEPAPAPRPRAQRARRAEGPRREHIRDRVRRKVESDLERGARRSGP